MQIDDNVWWKEKAEHIYFACKNDLPTEAQLSFLQLIEETEKRKARDILDSFFETVSLLRQEIKEERDNL